LIKGIIDIIRPLNILIAMLSVYVGGIISSPQYYDINILLAALSAGCIAGFGNVVNDIFDLEIDVIARPNRPLPSEKIDIREAFILAMILVIPGIILAAIINKQCLLIASLAAVVLLSYTPVFKGRGYSGNLLVAFIVATAFFYGAASVYDIEHGTIPAIFALLYNLVREIVKDMEDYETDKAKGIQTGAVKYGLKTSTTIAVTVGFVMIAATIVPYIFDIYDIGYLIAVVLGVDLFVIYLIFRLLNSPEKSTYGFVARFMKALMPLGLLAIFLGSRGL
jgi:geranylgeranylglycerol-phosphate geranylgeranyltransferase